MIIKIIIMYITIYSYIVNGFVSESMQLNINWQDWKYTTFMCFQLLQSKYLTEQRADNLTRTYSKTLHNSLQFT